MERKKVEEPNKVPLLLFSGGMDSTYMLWEHLQEGNVDVLYVNGLIGENKIAKEKEARIKIIDKLQTLTGNKVVKELEANTGNLFGGNLAAVGFSQMPMWLIGALQVLDPDRHSFLAIGYVAGDQIASRIPYITQAWDYLQYSCGYIDRHVPVRFPLQTTKKLQILENIPANILQHVWICEMPEWWRNGERVWDGRTGGQLKACKQCAACLTIAGTLEMYRVRHGRPYSHDFIHELRRKKEMALAKIAYKIEQEERKNDDEYQEIQLSPENICDPSVDTLSG